MRHRSARLLVLLALLALVLFLSWNVRRSSTASRLARETSYADPQVVARFLALEAREQEVEQTVWAKEMRAQECARVFESLWDSLNAATNKLRALASFAVGEVVVAKFNPPEKIAHGIEIHSPSGKGQTWSAVEWARFLQASEKAGWQLANTEFRHVQFDTDAPGQPKQSRFYFRAHLVNSEHSERAMFDGDLVVQWTPKQASTELPGVRQVDATRLTLRTRAGDPPFIPILNETIAPPDKSHFIDPLVLYDLDGDGRSEIILVARNLVYRQRPGGHFEAGPLCRYPVGLLFTGVLADFDGDGAADLVAVGFEGVFFFKGSPQGTFEEPGRLAWAANPHFRYAQAITCGDIDHDGDLDLFIAQYKVPYAGGQMPTPYYDANDGDPAYLLLNDGHGNFTDATDAAGLGKKRRRRTYSASLADLDGDGHLDLLVISDFAGVDVYRNDGRGHFTDVTREWIPEPHAFGMAHALADFNADGRLDFLMIGMYSPTADRLNHLDLWRPGIAEDRPMRARMTYGNRLFFARPAGGFEQAALSDFIARSGWSWGCAASDFDNDGFLDVYIATGHETRQSVRDYEPEFWLHDIYAATSANDSAANVYFQSKFNNRVGHDQSYGGYEKNRFFLNQRGAAFIEVGHLLGLSLEEDSRGVVADDLDGDGRLDLLLTTFEAWPETRQTLRVYRNNLNETGNWIGFRFREEGNGTSPVGATITVRHSGGIVTRQIVTGDSYRSQQANTVHFGLGSVMRVESVEIRWINGRKVTLQDPAMNRYHVISATP
ncbi:MAG TPA: CRTAC1 family protein [Pyrinomonadaceae bacterium]|nr:CRTAC1 family protein [Pyrinomonadaceae bacterium]